MDRSRFVLIVALSALAAAGGALFISKQLRAAEEDRNPLEEAEEMINEINRKMSEIQSKLAGRHVVPPSPA